MVSLISLQAPFATAYKTMKWTQLQQAQKKRTCLTLLSFSISLKLPAKIPSFTLQ
jgi:hypothetical protein